MSDSERRCACHWGRPRR